MDDFESTLSKVLSDPESMQKIFSIAQSLGLNAPTAEPEALPKEQSLPELPDSGMLQMMQALMQSSTHENTRQAELLGALRPFLRPERQQSLDRALRMAKLSRLARIAMNNLTI